MILLLLNPAGASVCKCSERPGGGLPPTCRKEFTLKISSNNSEGVYSMVRFPRGLRQNLQGASSYFQRAELRPSESMRKAEERRREKTKQRTPKQPAEF